MYSCSKNCTEDAPAYRNWEQLLQLIPTLKISVKRGFPAFLANGLVKIVQNHPNMMKHQNTHV